ncbi:MAG: small ribosomal subunit Rsm22 family protein [Ruminiclostridium sp.]
MELPYELKQIIENEALKIKTSSLSAAAEAISEKYRSEKGDGSRIVTDKAEIAAYSAVRMPATFGAVSAALSYAKECADIEIRSLIDVGAGTGAAAWAFAEAFDEAERVICLEREVSMSSFGRKLMEEGGFPAECLWKEFDISTDDITDKADLVTVSYMLNELNEKSRLRAVEKLWNAAEKMLLIVEPGTMAGFRNIIAARDFLISAGAEIAAPCPARCACPLSEEDWCHFTVRVPRTRLHKSLKGGDVPYEDEKFCYIAAVRGEAKPCKNRILRHPKIESGKITLRLCSGENITEQIVTKKSGGLFKKARKADCGDSF